MFELKDLKSSLINRIIYAPDTELLTIYFNKYYLEWATYKEVPLSYFFQFSEEKSIGKFYLSMIKPNFSLLQTNLMANKPKGINNATSEKKRFIKQRIDVTKINKDWLFVSEKGSVYLDVTLQLLPDGTVDQYENLGMITQDVPKEVFEKEKKLPADKRSQGAILGNGKELLWGEADADGQPGSGAGTIASDKPDALDDLPF